MHNMEKLLELCTNRFYGIFCHYEPPCEYPYFR